MLKDLLKKRSQRQGPDPTSMMNWTSGMPQYDYQTNGMNYFQAGMSQPAGGPYQGQIPGWPAFSEQAMYQASGHFETEASNQGYYGPLMMPYTNDPYQAPLMQSPAQNPIQNSNPIPNGYQPYQAAPEMNPYPKQQPNPFQNPLYQQDEDFHPVQPPMMNVTHPYPKPSFLQKSQGNNISSVLNQFKNQEGSIDFNKMMDTTGQMLNTMNQVSNLVKGVGSIFKTGT